MKIGKKRKDSVKELLTERETQMYDAFLTIQGMNVTREDWEGLLKKVGVYRKKEYRTYCLFGRFRVWEVRVSEFD